MAPQAEITTVSSIVSTTVIVTAYRGASTTMRERLAAVASKQGSGSMVRRLRRCPFDAVTLRAPLELAEVHELIVLRDRLHDVPVLHDAAAPDAEEVDDGHLGPSEVHA